MLKDLQHFNFRLCVLAPNVSLLLNITPKILCSSRISMLYILRQDDAYMPLLREKQAQAVFSRDNLKPFTSAHFVRLLTATCNILLNIARLQDDTDTCRSSA